MAAATRHSLSLSFSLSLSVCLSLSQWFPRPVDQQQLVGQLIRLQNRPWQGSWAARAHLRVLRRGLLWLEEQRHRMPARSRRPQRSSHLGNNKLHRKNNACCCTRDRRNRWPAPSSCKATVHSLNVEANITVIAWHALRTSDNSTAFASPSFFLAGRLVALATCRLSACH